MPREGYRQTGCFETTHRWVRLRTTVDAQATGRFDWAIPSSTLLSSMQQQTCCWQKQALKLGEPSEHSPLTRILRRSWILNHFGRVHLSITGFCQFQNRNWQETMYCTVSLDRMDLFAVIQASEYTKLLSMHNSNAIDADLLMIVLYSHTTLHWRS